jgi:uncharacterized protein YraI
MSDAATPGDPPEPPLPAELQGGPQPAAALPAEDGSLLADWQSLLRNRLIIGGLAVLIVLLMTTLVLVLLGGGDGANGSPPAVNVRTPVNTATPVPPGVVIGRMRSTASLRSGPDELFAPLGTIRTGVVLTIIGRSEDDVWLQVVYPPGSQLRGWVNRDLLEVTGDVSELAVAGPNLGPDVEVPTVTFFEPTFEPLPTEVGEGEPTPTEEEPEEETPKPTNTRYPTATPIRVRSATPTSPNPASAQQ